MVCRNCGNSIADNSKFCSVCGSPVVEDSVTNNFEERKKDSKIFIIIGGIILVLVIVAILFFHLYFGSSNENKSNKSDNLLGKVIKVQEDGDYAKYTLKIDGVNHNAKYDFKVGNNTITLEFKDDDDDVIWVTYVDGHKILDDGDFVGDISENFEKDVHKLGNYLVLTNHDFSYVKAESIYIVNKSGKLERTLYDLTGDCLVYSNDFEIDKNGITLVADRRAMTGESACNTKFGDSNYAWDNEDVDLCDRASWPEGFGEKKYKATYQFKYENGVLDTTGVVIDSQTVNDYINSEDFGYYCTE